MSFADDFLPDHDPRTWSHAAGPGDDLRARLYYLGHGEHALEVAVAEARSRPRADQVRALWHERQRRRPSPVLLVVGYLHGGRVEVVICGPVGENPPLVFDLDVSQVERLCVAALAEPSRHAAVRFLVSMLPEVGSDLPGLRNAGLLATQELVNGVPQGPDWQAACTASMPLLTLAGQRLVERLGFRIEALTTVGSVLTARDTKRAVAVFLDETETFDDASARFGSTPVAHGLALADREGLPWVLMTRGGQIRVYAARADTGVGRKGRAATFVEVNLALLPEATSGYLWLLFSADALTEGGSLDKILDRSADFAAGLGSRLRDRVYFEAVPSLSRALAARLPAGALAGSDLGQAYEQTLMVLFRLLFVAYGEDKDLLPYRTNSRYNDHSLKRMARRLAEWRQRSEPFDERATDLWSDVSALWDAVRGGNAGWGVPAYDGGLFSNDPGVSPAGAELAFVSLTDAEFGPALTALLVDEGPDGVVGPVDFRSLSVREFGTLYEGLLESRLSVAENDLSVDDKGNYVPTRGRQQVAVTAGSVYFHNRSGSRKATGSYFTKPFAVEHLLDHALEPALTDHVARLTALVDAGDDARAAEAFFDFRCADLAMGSGHFLVAAVDRIEARLAGFLALHPVPQVLSELEELRAAALDALGQLASGTEIETTSLLRRLVARRCVYGVDRNHMAVELARLAVWIHTFVPGLPLSFLSHTLVEGDSLTGIATLDEALAMLDPETVPGQPSLLRDQIEVFLSRAQTALRRLAVTVEKTTRDVEASRAAQAEALAAVEPARQLFNILVAARLGLTHVPVDVEEDNIARHPGAATASQVTTQLGCLHFPVVFPEVLLRERPGFDCIIGNPPWDKVLFEPQAFWVARSPGLNALSQPERLAAISRLRAERPDEAHAEDEERANRELLQQLVEATYEYRGRGHYDFAKLFVERAVKLLARHATLGYVLPANSLLVSGWGRLRELLMSGCDLTVVEARNTNGWLFDDVHKSYAVVLLSRQPAAGTEEEVIVHPGVKTIAALRAKEGDAILALPRATLETLSDSVVVPWMNDSAERDIFESMRVHPSLASGTGWLTGTHDARWDFRSSGPHRSHASTRPGPGSWRILMTRHVTAYAIDEHPAFQQFVAQPAKLDNGIVTGASGAILGEDHPRVIFRHPSRNDDSRTMIATMLPDKGYLHNKGYVHAIRHERGTSIEQLLAALGLLNTFTCDWWVRRFVDRHVTAPVVNNIRLPAWDSRDVAHAAQLASALLVMNGRIIMLNGQPLSRPLDDRPKLDLLADLEALAARGFDLGREHVSLLLDDFSDRPAACPPALRAAILERLR